MEPARLPVALSCAGSVDASAIGWRPGARGIRRSARRDRSIRQRRRSSIQARPVPVDRFVGDMTGSPNLGYNLRRADMPASKSSKSQKALRPSHAWPIQVVSRQPSSEFRHEFKAGSSSHSGWPSRIRQRRARSRFSKHASPAFGCRCFGLQPLPSFGCLSTLLPISRHCRRRSYRCHQSSSEDESSSMPFESYGRSYGYCGRTCSWLYGFRINQLGERLRISDRAKTLP